MSAGATAGSSKRAVSVDKISEGEEKVYPDIDCNFLQPDPTVGKRAEDEAGAETPPMLVIDYLKLLGMKP